MSFYDKLKFDSNGLIPAIVQEQKTGRVVMMAWMNRASLESTIATFTDISLRDIAQQEKLEKEKLQGVLEMAGAICHEINQPIQAIIGYSELFDPPEAITAKELEQIKFQATRIGNITKRLSKITRYKTIPYPGDTKIVDIWGSSS